MMSGDRPSVAWTARTLTGGTLISAACFALGLALHVATGADAAAEDAARAGVLVLLATPAAGLVVTAAELRLSQPRSALLALVVLAVLAGAAGAALLGY